MGSSLSTIGYDIYGRKQKTVLMVGLDAAGITATLYWLALGRFSQTIPTMGYNIETIKYKDFALQMYDIGGGRYIDRKWPRLYQQLEASAVIFVVDCTDRERIDEARSQLWNLLNEDELANTHLLVLANKQDLPNAMDPDEVVKHLELSSLKIPWHIQATCAITGMGLAEALDWLVSPELDGHS